MRSLRGLVVSAVVCVTGCSGGSSGAFGDGGDAAGGTSGSGSGGTDSGGAGSGGAGTGGTGGGGSGGASSGGTGGGGSGGAGTGGGGAGGASGSGGADPTSVCARWNDDRVDLSEGSWSGDVGACDPGQLSATGVDHIVKLVNLYRFLVGLPPVSEDPGLRADVQSCSLMMDANGQLSHQPPTSWACYTANGAGTAGQSNIASTTGVQAIDLYMADPGNDTTLGHRRWILSNSLGPIGVGSTAGASCLRVIGGSGDAGRAFTAFPSGITPLEALNASWSSVDETGWSIQSDTIDLSSAVVTVTDGGASLAVSQVVLEPYYGSEHALRFVPQGWSAQAGHTYAVHVAGVSPAIDYTVQVEACPH